MSLATTLMAVGLPAEQANRLGYEDRVPLDGNGTTQGSATELMATQTNVALGTSVGDTAFRLPAEAEYFQEYFLLNTTAETALVFPPVGDTIDANALNASVGIDTDLARVFMRVEEGRWVSMPSGEGGGGIESIVAGTGINVDNTDPDNPVVSNDGVLSVSGGAGISVDITDPQNPVVINTGVVSVTAGSNVSITGTPENPIINSSNPGGTVTAVSVATANGFAGSSSGGATPALTLSTTQTGMLSGNGTALVARTITGTTGRIAVTNGNGSGDPTIDLAAATDVRNYLDTAVYVADRTALAAIDQTKETVAWLKETRREGVFQWSGANLSSQVTLDTQQGIYVAPASDTTGASGAWVRIYSGSASVQWFGAVGDGTTDDATAIQKAIDLVRDIWFPQAAYAVGTRLQIGNGTSSAISTRNGYNLRGSTAGTTSVETGPVLQPTRLKWIGSTFNSILRIDGPMVGCNINGLVFDCNNIAGSNGIHTRHMMLSTWQDVVVTNNTGTGIIHESYPSFAGSVQGANKNTFTNVRVVGCGAQGSGIRIGNTAGTSGDVLDVAQNVWINCHFERDGTHAPAFSIWLGFTDNITFIETVVTASGGSLGVGVYIQEPTGGTLNTFPDEVLFLNCPILDGFVASGTWTPSGGVICYPYPTGDGEPIPTSDYIRGSTFTHTFFNGLRLGAGKATVAPLKFTSGTLETTAEAGAVEYDGKAFYATSAASSRQVIAAKQIATVQGSAVALTNNIATAQSIFAAANDTLTVAAATTYRFRAVLKFNTGATSHTTAFGFGGTATFTSCNYSSRATSSAANTLATPQQRRVAAATATVLTAASTAVTTDIEIEGMIRINGAGTIIPQVTFSAGPTGTCETAIDSFFELEPIGSNTVAAVGNWS